MSMLIGCATITADVFEDREKKRRDGKSVGFRETERRMERREERIKKGKREKKGKETEREDEDEERRER